MTVLWMQQDAAEKVLQALRRGAKSLNIRTQVPDKWTPKDSPIVTVVSDGTPTGGSGWDRELVRVTARAKDIPTARKIMGTLDAFLTTPLRAGFLGISPATGLIVSTDSRLGGGGLASVTYGVTTNRKRM